MRPFSTIAALLLLAFALSGLDFLDALLAPKAELWPRWEAHDPASTAAIDHGPWARFLAKYLSTGADGVARVAYGRVSAADQEALQAYLAGLSALPISTCTRAEQLAFWVNLYNALTVELILTHYPVKSILDISGGLFASGPWDLQIAEVERQAISLNDVEHRILRPIWREPRLHYVLNCASLGCPNLRARPFPAQGAEAVLEEAARAFINDPRAVRVEDEGLVASKIYNWFAEDFGGSEADVLAHLRRYAAPALAEKVAGAEEIAAYAYDWNLNDADGEPPGSK